MSSFVTSCNAFAGVDHSIDDRKTKAAGGRLVLSARRAGAETKNVFKYTTNNRILCKTVETFKLADLYYLEVSIKAGLRGMRCERIGIDSATGSSLLGLGDLNNDCGISRRRNGEDSTAGSFPFTSCMEWVGVELAQADDAQGLIQELQSRAHEIEDVMVEYVTDNGGSQDEAFWKMAYARMRLSSTLPLPDQYSSRTKSKYTAKTLSYCVAQTLRAPAALDPTNATLDLVLVDNNSSIMLCLVASPLKDDNNGVRNNKYTANINAVKETWSSRPFQYSSAMNPVAAAIVVDMLLDYLCRAKNTVAEDITLLDPTCGSGTFLAYAMAAGATVVGWDVNERCVEGTMRNLAYLVGQGLKLTGDETYIIQQRDATLLKPDDNDVISKSFDCIVANLPWGLNTPTYYEEDMKIIEALRKLLRRGSPCAFISRDIDIQKELRRLQYDVLGTAFIPHSNFRLPTSEKKNKKPKKRVISVVDEDAWESSTDNVSSSSRCIVTFAIAA